MVDHYHNKADGLLCPLKVPCVRPGYQGIPYLHHYQRVYSYLVYCVIAVLYVTLLSESALFSKQGVVVEEMPHELNQINFLN